jgi:large subunit ribosomal protein L10
VNENLRQKQETVAEIKDKFSRAKSLVFVEYSGTTVAQVTELRNNIRKANAEYKVYKNKLMQRALAELNIAAPELAGTTAVAISYEDETSPANVIVNAGKENQNLKVKFGIVNNNVVDNKYVEMLANIPAREVLLSQLLGMLQAPIRNLACVLKAAADK